MTLSVIKNIFHAHNLVLTDFSEGVGVGEKRTILCVQRCSIWYVEILYGEGMGCSLDKKKG